MIPHRVAAGILLVLTSASAGLAQDCSVWSLRGYRLGMTRDAALAVRGPDGRVGKLKKHGTQLLRRVSESGSVSTWDGNVRVHFNEAGVAAAVDFVTEAPGLAFKLDLVRQLGQPTSDDIVVPVNTGVLDPRVDYLRSSWESAECDADIVFARAMHQSEMISSARVYLVHHGAAPLPD